MEIANVRGWEKQFMQALAKFDVDVAEIYSPPRVTNYAEESNLQAGWSLDLTAHGEEGIECDFQKNP